MSQGDFKGSFGCITSKLFVHLAAQNVQKVQNEENAELWRSQTRSYIPISMK